MRRFFLWVCAVMAAILSGGAASAEGLAVGGLRCEYKVDPLGIEVAKPRLTWLLESDAQGAAQEAYQILVASTPELLAADKGDLWDSGKVESRETALVPYGGKALEARARCHWKVRAWEAGAKAPGAWSAPALWTMGLMGPEGWSAEWIGYDAPDPAAPAKAEEPVVFTKAFWIWGTPGKFQDNAPVGMNFFRKVVDLPQDKAIASAKLYLAADNSAEAYINGAKVNGKADGFKNAAELDVTKKLTPGRNVIAVQAENSGDKANPAGMIAELVVAYADGSTLHIATDKTWKVAKANALGDWMRVDLDDSGWDNAPETVPNGSAPWGMLKGPGPLILPPPPYLRHEFAAKPGIKRATVYATALGLYELQINGQRVGEDVLTPGWTEFRKRVHYSTYDVTNLVKPDAQNCVGAILADGWYAGYIGFRLLVGMDRPRNYYGGEPRLRAQLEIEYDDGHIEKVVTNGDWKASYGPIREADLLMGEAQDLRLDNAGWSTPGYDAAAWQPVVTGTDAKIAVEPHPGDPVRRQEELPAKTVKEIKPGVFIYDLGQNMVGHARVKAKGKAGDKVQLRFAERLENNGEMYTINYRKARCIDTFTLRGDQEETLEPKFTFRGFQYVEISGLQTPPAPGDVVGVVVNSDITQTGTFECSEPLLNQLFHNIVWGQKGNYLEVPTDCPQRDERAGWTGDAQFFIPTAAYIADVGAFFTKWLVDLVQDSQAADGGFADIAPNLDLGTGTVAWGDAAIICTYNIYKYYGDTRIIAQHYDNLNKGMDYLRKTSDNFIRKKLGYGDWLNKGGGAKDEVICTAYYAYLSGLMAEMGQAINRADDAARYRTQREQIKDAFIKAFVAPDGKILESSQTGYALAFTMDLLPEDRKAGAANYFAEEIKKFDMHLATGFIGTPRLLPGLVNAGKRDIAYQLLMTKTYPSWLFPVTLGATTMWERWDGWTPDKGFQDPGMNSFNHYAFGAVGEFLFTDVGGIRNDSVGFKEITIAPHPGGGLTYANTSYNSIRGKITSNWKIEGKTFTLEVVVPPNVTAKVRVPAADPSKVTNSDLAHAQPQAAEEGAAVFAVQPGRYTFGGEIE